MSYPMDRDYIKDLTQLKDILEEDFTYWTHEGIIYRSPMGELDFLTEVLGPGGWMEPL